MKTECIHCGQPSDAHGDDCDPADLILHLKKRLAAAQADNEKLRKRLMPSCDCLTCRGILEQALAERARVTPHEAIKKAAEKSKNSRIKQDQKGGDDD